MFSVSLVISSGTSYLWYHLYSFKQPDKYHLGGFHAVQRCGVIFTPMHENAHFAVKIIAENYWAVYRSQIHYSHRNGHCAEEEREQRNTVFINV